MNETQTTAAQTKDTIHTHLGMDLEESGNIKVHVVMLHFDALFDLRVAALGVVSPEFAQMCKLDLNYYRRKHDVFGAGVYQQGTIGYHHYPAMCGCGNTSQCHQAA
jgi:hypothetical protein